MIHIMQSQRVSKTYYVTCPHCFADIPFNNVSPVYCPKCIMELMDYHNLIFLMHERVAYHFSS